MKDSNDSSEPQAAPQRARLDAFAEDFLERLLDVATHLYGTPTALLALAQEDDRLRVAAATTMGAGETEFYRAACQRVVQVGEAIFLNGPAAAMLFADATHDDVPTPRFFAGAPVRAPDGQIAGALCVVGRQAPSTESPAPLETLARVAADELELLRAATKAPPAANRDTAGRSAENAGAEDAGTDASSATEGAASASAPLDLSGPLFQQHPLPMWVYDLNTLRFLAVNEAAVEAYGYSADEFRQMRITDIRPDDEVSRLWATLEQPHAGRQQTARGTHRTQDGRTLHVETTSRVLSGETRDAVLVTVQNVTPYAEALRDLRSRERRLDQTLASIGDAVITTDPSTRVTRMNAAAEALTGWTQDDAEGHPLANVLELQHAQTGEPVAPPVREAMRSRARVSLPAPTTLVARDGSERPVADSAAPILDDDGTLLGGVLVLHDVSDARAQEKTRRSQRQRLQRQQRMFATLAEQARDVWNDIDRLLQTTTEIVSEAFDAQRVGVWRYDAEQPVLESLDTYDRAAGTHTGGTMLTESDCPAYFNALSEGQVIAIDDARRDVRTIGLESAYLADHGIAALLDAPIRVGGRPIGVLCIEAVGEGRSWTTDEQIAARSVADFIALAFESSGRRETESALRESEEQLDLALRGVDLGLWDWNVQGNSDDRWAEMLGFRLDDLSGHADAVADLVPPDDRAAMQDALEAHLAGETPYFECEFRARTENGAWRWFLSRGRVVASTDDGDPQRVVGTTLDITERKEQAAAVERFGRLLEASANEIIIFRADTLAIVQANRGAREHLGYAEDELLGMTPLDIKPFGREALEERLRPLRSGDRELLTFETTHRRKDGSTYPVRVRLQLSSQETPPVFIAIAHDITAEKEAERALRESEQRFRDVVEATGEYVWELNADRAYTFVTDQVEAVKGHGAQAVLGRTPFDFMPEADAQAMRTALDRAEAEQEPFTLEHRNRTPDGGVEWERASGVPVVDDDGAVVGFRGTGLSVTEQREVEQAMREQQARLRGIANSVPGVIYQFYVRPDGTRGLHFVSDRAQSILGLAPDPDTFFEALQTHIPEAHREVHRSAVAASVDAAEPWDYEVPFDTADGERLWLRNVATPEQRDGELVFNGVVLDITERKQAQKDLQREQEFLQKLFDRIPVLITLYAPDQSHFQVNKEFERVLGWSSDELDDLDLMEACYPDPEVREEATAFMASPGPEWRDFPVRTKDGDEVLCSWTNIRLSDDTMVGVGIDRTERRQLEAQLRQAQRMETVGTLAGGIAHDFNNILHAAMVYLQMGLEDLPDESNAHSFLSEAEQGLQQAATLVSKLLTFSRQEGKSVELAVDLVEVVQGSIDLVQPSLPPNVTVRTEFGDACTVLGDPRQLQQVAMNLMTNAADAMAETPDRSDAVLDVDVRATVVDEDMSRRYLNLDPGHYVRLSVSDTGVGMDAETKARVFEPFFTTKEGGRGTGLGLSVVHGIVQAHDGETTVFSAPGEGSTFNVYLPHPHDEEDESVAEPAEAQSSAPAKHILFVDDDESVVELETVRLQRLGYRVTTATDAADALQTIDSASDRFDLVLTDYAMPGMNGLELVRELRERGVEVPIVLMSGFSAQVSEAAARQMGVEAFLRKPVGSNELKNALSDLL